MLVCAGHSVAPPGYPRSCSRNVPLIISAIAALIACGLIILMICIIVTQINMTSGVSGIQRANLNLMALRVAANIVTAILFTVTAAMNYQVIKVVHAIQQPAGIYEELYRRIREIEERVRRLEERLRS